MALAMPSVFNPSAGRVSELLHANVYCQDERYRQALITSGTENIVFCHLSEILYSVEAEFQPHAQCRL